MRLLAISDLHLGYAANRDVIAALPASPDDWLILAGDIGETLDHLRFAIETLRPRFARMVWVPGNHDLWTWPRDPCRLKGEARYLELVELCRAHDVLTPEDPYAAFDDRTIVAPLFLGYDYTFAPDGMSPTDARAWAAEAGIYCADEHWLGTAPYADMAAWCHARVAYTERRLAAVVAGKRLVLVNHYPLRRDLCRPLRIPRFSPWCGTRLTEDWHTRFPVDIVVSGHLHMPATDWRDGVRFEEVSLGYPNQWRRRARPPEAHLRVILPAPPAPATGFGGPFWHR